MLFSSASLATTIKIDFNDPNSTNSFNTFQNEQFTYLPSSGVSGTGAVYDNNLRATYKEQSFDFSSIGTQITLSALSKLPSNITSDPGYIKNFAEFSLVPEADSFHFTDNVAFAEFGQTNTGVRLFGGPLQTGGGGFPGFLENLPLGLLRPDNWFQFGVTFTNLGDRLGFNLFINDFGIDGSQLVSSLANNHFETPDPHGLTRDGDVFAGFWITAQTVAWDNFQISVNASSIQEPSPSVPVPAPPMMLLFVVSLFVIVRKRHKG